jgi:hypothetical protein
VTVTGGGITRTVSVTQAGTSPTVTLTVEYTNVNLYFVSGIGYNVNVTSNVAWTVSASADWIDVRKNDTYIWIGASENRGYSTRTGTVTVKAGDLTRTITVSQNGAPSGAFNILPVVLTSGNINIYVRTASSWTISSSVNWLTFPKNSGMGDELIIVKSQTNTEGRTRTGTVTITCTCGEKKTFTVTQEAGSSLATANETVESPEAEVYCYSGRLTVNTPVAEQVYLYSISGGLLFSTSKEAGHATFDLGGLPKGVLIVKGSSGWTKKIVNSQ